LNTNSLISIRKKYALKNLIDEEHPDIIMLSETNLTKKHNLNYPGYNVIKDDISHDRRGTAILLQKKIEI
jgi:exonuclease III